MTKAEAKQIAKHTLIGSLGNISFKIYDDNSYSQEEKDLIINYLDKYVNSVVAKLNKNK